jgi:hypothetical protein
MAETEIIHGVRLPSGSVWQLIDPPAECFRLAGKLPAGLLSKVAPKSKAPGIDDDELRRLAFKKLSPEEVVSNLTFARELLALCSRDPKISLVTPTPADAIAPENILPEDFEFLKDWILSGGNAGRSWLPMVENDDNLLFLALAGEKFGRSPSSVFGADPNGVGSISFDLACLERLLIWENERDFGRLKSHRVMTRAAVFEAVALHWIEGYTVPQDDDGEASEISDDDTL